MKKKILLLALIVICLATLAGGTLARHRNSVHTHNVVTTNGVELLLVEYDKNGEEWVELGASDPAALDVFPGKTIERKAEFVNTKADAWLRAKLELSCSNAEVDNLEDCVKLNINSNWTLSDGWYYYNSALDNDQNNTATLFDRISFDGSVMGNEYQGATVTVKVYAEAVQSAHNGATVFEAVGWPGA